MAGARVPGHRGPESMQAIDEAFIVRETAGVPRVFKVKILSRTDKRVRVAQGVSSNYSRRFDPEEFDRYYKPTREEAITLWRARLRRMIEDGTDSIAVCTKLLQVEPKDFRG